MARAAANVSRLELAMRIPKRNLSRTDTEDLWVQRLCAPTADEVLLACGAAGLRAVSLHTAQLAAHEPTDIRYVQSVAFDAHTDTLLLVVISPTDYLQLVSLRRNASKWLEVQRRDTRISSVPLQFAFSVCDSRVLLAGREGNSSTFDSHRLRTLYVFAVSAEHTLRDAGSVTWQSDSYQLTCTRRDGDTLVAFFRDTSSVYLQRLASLPLRLEPLASVDVTDPWRLLFRGDLLLLAEYYRATELTDIVSLRVSGNALTERRVLLNDVCVGLWALAGDRLVLFDWKSNDLLVYDFI